MIERISHPIESSSGKKRWDSIEGRTVVVPDNEAFRARLAELREKSTSLNKLLQRKLDEAGLPYYAWNKTSPETRVDRRIVYPKILRIAVMLRPSFFHSEEPKTAQTRYTTSDDQITFILHLTENNDLQVIRLHSDLSPGANKAYFTDSAFPIVKGDRMSEGRKELEVLLHDQNVEGLADFVVRRLTPSSHRVESGNTYAQAATEYYQRAYTLATPAEVRSYVREGHRLVWESKEIIRNLAKVAVTSILEHAIRAWIRRKKSPAAAPDGLQKKAAEALSATFSHKSLGENLALGSFIPDADAYVRQTIQRLIRAYKNELYGWKKAD